MHFEIAPLRALRFDPDRVRSLGGGTPDDLVSPPYDIVDADEHRRLLGRSPWNIVRLTLGDSPGEKESYSVRARRLLDWKSQGVLREDSGPALYVYGCDYPVPGTMRRASFRGLVALGRLHPFEDRIVLPHERTFPRVVDDRYRLLEATRTHLETIFLLFEDREADIDRMLAQGATGAPLLSVESRPGETHSLWTVADGGVERQLVDLFRGQRPIIADGHHRYTTAILYRDRNRENPRTRPGSEWQPMVFGNLVGEGLSILATHRLVDTGGRAGAALEILDERLEPAGDDDSADWSYSVETPSIRRRYRLPADSVAERTGVAATDYAFLHEVVLGQWLGRLVARGEDGEPRVSFFKEGTGEAEALRRGDGDLLFRLRPVSPETFRSVVDGGEVFPHKTTFFYPKLWSGLLLWSLGDPERS